MSEDKKEIKTAKEGDDKSSSENSDEGSKYETTPIIERAREEREKLEAATKAQREENDRTERIQTKQALGGVTEAGNQPLEISQEQKKNNNAEEFFKDTALGDAIRKTNEKKRLEG